MGKARPSVAPSRPENPGAEGSHRPQDRRARPAPHELDDLIHQRVRLGIMSALAATDRMSFSDLKDLLETSDGNLSSHARRLEEGGYLVCEKSFEGRVPHTEYRLTDRGREALERYLEHMEGLIDAVRDR